MKTKKFKIPATATVANIEGSSAVKALAYDSQNERLYITFKDGKSTRSYQVDGITRHQFAYGRKAPSVGRWANKICRENSAVRI